MSAVTTMMMLPNSREPFQTINEFQAALKAADTDRGQQFQSLSEVREWPVPSPTDHWGGSKAPEAEVWGAALNHVPAADVLAAARTVRWCFHVIFVWQDPYGDSWQTETVHPAVCAGHL